MKRKAPTNGNVQECEVLVTVLKKERFNQQVRMPATLMEPRPLHNDTSRLLERVGVSQNVQFFVFLDPQGKEYINHISIICIRFLSDIVFVSQGMATNTTNGQEIFRYLDSDTSKCLAKELGIIDPLGGGSYPLNYLVVVASGLVHCMLPIRIGNRCGKLQRFGICMSELDGILEEYLDYFSSQDVVITNEAFGDAVMLF